MRKHLEDSLDLPLEEILPILQSRILDETTYFGIKTLKNPLDFWVYQEIIHEMRPDLIVEIGNYRGGSTLALAHTMDLLGHGRVIAVDISHEDVAAPVRRHPRITLVEGDALESFERVDGQIDPGQKALVIEDSSHTYENTLQVLRLYGKFVQIGGYFIVEDTICHHGLDVGPEPGPYEAVETFVAENEDFVVDRDRESFLMTWNPRGFLRRVS